MISLPRSIGALWQQSVTLCDLIPYSRVFTGRIPQTELYRFPYVSIIASQGAQVCRTDKTRISHNPVSFHIWVDDSQLEFAERVADFIAQVYADRCWTLSTDAVVMDVLDEGEPMAIQTDLPNVKAWEVVKLVTVVLERARVDHTEDECCSGDPVATSSSSEDEVASSSSSSS